MSIKQPYSPDDAYQRVREADVLPPLSNRPHPYSQPSITDLPSAFQNAVFEVARNEGIPVEICVASALGTLSLAAQGLINIQRPGMDPSACSLYLITVAESGDRKSTADRHFMKPIKEFERHHQKLQENSWTAFTNKKQVYDEKQKALLSRIKRLTVQGRSTEDVERDLEKLQAEEPSQPKGVRLIMNDATPEAIVQSLYENSRSAGLMSDEGGVVFNSRAMNNLAVLNRLWDGDGISVDRASYPSFTLDNCRFTVSVMVQSNRFEQFRSKNESAARDSGFFARCLTARARSLKGSRLAVEKSWQYVPQYQQRIDQILAQSGGYPEDEGGNIRILRFSPEALAVWHQFVNDIEVMQGPGKPWHAISDFASKVPENAARISALFHLFEGRQGDIQADILGQSIRLMRWYTLEFWELFEHEVNIPQSTGDAHRLARWLATRYGDDPAGATSIERSKIASSLPQVFRKNVARTDAAFSMLESWNWISVDKSSRARKFTLSREIPEMPGLPNSSAPPWSHKVVSRFGRL